MTKSDSSVVFDVARGPHKLRHYIDGQWVLSDAEAQIAVIDPSTEEVVGSVPAGSPGDVGKAVAAARRGFARWSSSPRAERLSCLKRLLPAYEQRYDDIARAISLEMGAPIRLSKGYQTSLGVAQIEESIRQLEAFAFERPLNEPDDGQRLIFDPIGVCGLITPWNWPINEVLGKVLPAIAMGCTVILKPSELSPLSAQILAELFHEVELPPGVFNIVHGSGPIVGDALSRHPDVDMISFTGSVRAGTAVSKAAADTIKRVVLELGGKSPNLIFADAQLDEAVRGGVAHCFENSGQSCNAPTRMLVERSIYDQAVAIAAEAANKVSVADPRRDGDHLGPVVSNDQYERIQNLIEGGMAEGARIVAGGPGRPAGLNRGAYVRPTVFADVSNDMRIAQEEVFGPVLVMIPFDTEDEAIALANASDFGLAAYLHTCDSDRARRVARRIRAGNIHVNGLALGKGSPFGGYKKSGNGRVGGQWSLENYLEIKAVTPVE